MNTLAEENTATFETDEISVGGIEANDLSPEEFASLHEIGELSIGDSLGLAAVKEFENTEDVPVAEEFEHAGEF